MLPENAAFTTGPQNARRLAAVALLAALAALAATALAPADVGADARDRSAAAALDRRLAIFRDIESAPFGASLARDLRACPPLEQRIAAGKKSFGAAFSALLTSGFDLSLPLTIELADRYESQLTALRGMLAGMHVDAPLFARWLSTERRSVDLILGFANDGQPVNACRAATYLQGLSKLPARDMAAALAGFGREVGISLARYKTLAPGFFSGSNPADALSGLAPRMEAFFRAAGLSPADAAVLSTSE